MELKQHALTLSQVFRVISLAQTDSSFLLCPGSLISMLQPAAFPCGNSTGEVIPSSLLLDRLFLQFYEWVHCVPWSCWPGTPLHPSLITWTPTQATQNTVSWVVKVSKRVSPNRKVQLISHPLDYDRPTQIMTPLTKWRRIWQILTVTSPSEVGPKVNSP